MTIQRVTIPLVRVVAAIMDDPRGEHYGYELSQITGLAPGSVQPILTRLEDAGWLTHRWEDIDPSEAGRRPRRLYQLTGTGARAANSMLQEHGAKIAPIGHPRGAVT